MTMRATATFNSVRRVLAERSFSDDQIARILPRLHEEHKRRPETLAEIIDCWNTLMGRNLVDEGMEELRSGHMLDSVPKTAGPPASCPVAKRRIDMTTILADVEPDLLLFSPGKLIQRQRNLQGLGIIQNISQFWIALFNAPRGYYLQDWSELTRKIMYVDRKVIDLLYDKREQRAIDVHPLVTHAAVTETDFDHIRTRYLFAERTGFAALSHMRTVQTALTRPTLKDMILVDDATYLSIFAPFCSQEEFSCFSNLIKNHELDEDDADLFTRMAELESLRHPGTHSSQSNRQRAEAKRDGDDDNKEVD